MRRGEQHDRQMLHVLSACPAVRSKSGTGAVVFGIVLTDESFRFYFEQASFCQKCGNSMTFQ